MPPQGKPEIKVANFNNMGVVIEPPLTSKEIAEKYLQTLSRLLAWNEVEQRFDFLTVDTDGRLHVATDEAKITEVNNSQATVTTTTEQLVVPLPGRKGLLLFNHGTVTVFFALSNYVLVATGMVLNPGVAFETNVWNGAVSMKTISGTSDVRIMEFS
ncbi:hypothetical protein LCGC14_1039920 [marine sediment metagenome]|uniref:Uncharacterized protein n=1 Tax=marine sediment metagenome TaxID=412755 RepID=A0A0F9MWJ1_9ZZZZ